MRLSPDARSIVDAARDGDDPTEDDKARVRRALAATIGTATAIGATSSAAAANAASASAIGASGAATATSAAAGAATVAGSTLGTSLLTKAIGVAIAVGIAGGTVALEPWNAGIESASDFEGAPVVETETIAAPQASPPSARSITAPAPVSAPAPVPVSVSAPALLQTPRAPARENARRSAPPPAPSPAAPDAPPIDLSAELTLVRNAEASRRAGRPAEALAHLEEHASRFPNGTLTAERQAGRVLALCDLGRTSEARALADRFASTYATSPLATRVANTCR